MPSTGGSRILENYRAPYDATAVRRMKEKGAIVVGKTNLDESGMGSTIERSAFQVTSNPRDTSRVPGGSSGGSAAVVSAGIADTGIILHAISGHDRYDATSTVDSNFDTDVYGKGSDQNLRVLGDKLTFLLSYLTRWSIHGTAKELMSTEVPDFTPLFTSGNLVESRPLKGLRVGLIRETLDEGVDNGVKSAISGAASHLEGLGCTVTEANNYNLGQNENFDGNICPFSWYYDAYYKRAQQVNRKMIRWHVASDSMTNNKEEENQVSALLQLERNAEDAPEWLLTFGISIGS
ncbi:hypothetical protein GH714_014855 [Hevea brasiliensis]|uniref:Amidase domain-containing protein n=1 Tax=Hevea brasiliensis TaxID=3981 RepID=A0A6A6KRE8_HEVBR|nr:hypothetical protein GH714_014855 [Hevea brasiliensis]